MTSDIICRQLHDAEKDKYEKFTEDNGASFLQSWDWGDWQKENGNTPLRLAVIESESFVAAAQFLIHQTPLGSYLYCPYGPVLNIKYQISNIKIIETISQYLSVNYPNCLFIRIEPTFGFNLQLTTYNLQLTTRTQPGSTIISDLKNTAEELLAGMHPKTRYGIRIAEKHGVIVKPIIPENKKIAANMFVDTLQRRGLAVQPASYFINIMDHNWESLSTSCMGAFFENKLLAVAFCIDFADTRTYLYGGSSTEHKEMMGPYLLHWQIMKDAKAKGLNRYDWWGAENSNGDKPGFVRFKERFGGELVTYPTAFDIVIRPAHFILYKWGRKINRLLRKYKTSLR